MDEAPDRAGVYVLYHGDTVIYMGSASSGNDTLLTILRAHRRGDIDEMTLQATHFSREVREQADARLASLMRQYQANHEWAVPLVNERQEPQQAQLAG